MLLQLYISELLLAADKSLHTVLLCLLLCRSLVSCCRPGEYKFNDLCCPMCSAGSVVRSHCTATAGSTACIPCVDGTYMDHPNGLTKCLRCKECDRGAGLVVKKECSSFSNTECECEPGFYCESEDSCDICTRHTQCEPGQFVKKAGNSRANTVCETCPHGHFSNESMAKMCTPWKRCSYTFIEGTSTSDSECRRHRFYLIIPFGIAIIVTIVLIALVHGFSVIRTAVEHGSSKYEKTSVEETGTAVT